MMAQLWRDALAAHPDVHVVANADDPMVVWAARRRRAGHLGQRRPALARRLLGLPRVRLAHRARRRATGGAPAAPCAARRRSGRVEDDGVVDPDRRLAPGQAAAARPGQPRQRGHRARRRGRSSASARSTRVPRLAAVASVAGRYAQVERDGRNIRLLLAKNPASWLEAFDMAEDGADPAVHQRPRPRRAGHLLALRRRLLPAARPAGADHRRPGDTTWRSGSRSTRCRSSTSRTFDEALGRGAARAARGHRQLHRVPGHPSGAGPCQLSHARLAASSWIYPDLLSTYGDRGNMLILARRADAARHPGRDRRGPLRPAAARPRRHLPARRRRGRPAGAGRPAARSPTAACTARSTGAPPCSPSAPATSSLGTSFFAKGAKCAGLDLLDLHSDRGPTRAVGELAGDVDPRLGLPAAHRLREPRRPHPPRPRRHAAGPGHRRHRQRRRAPRAPGRARSSAPTARPGAGPQPGPGRPAAALGDRRRQLAAARRHLARPAPRRAARRSGRRVSQPAPDPDRTDET